MEFLKWIYSAFADTIFSWFTFIPEWVIPDIIILILGILTVSFIIKKEERPTTILLEMFCFIFLYAAIYENLATVVGWYGYGQSIVMIFNITFAVPLIEALFVYAGLRMVKKMKLPLWAGIILIGCMGVLADLTLDPLSLAQVHNGIGRWSWFIEKGDVNIFGAPVYNYIGWFILCGYAAAFLSLGRFWHAKSEYKKWVGIIYPPICMLGALVVMCSPISSFILWLGPFFVKGGWTEWLMFGLVFALMTVILIWWRGQMKEKLTWQNDWICPIIFGVFYATNIIFDIVALRFDILFFSLPFIAIHGLIFFIAFYKKRRM